MGDYGSHALNLSLRGESGGAEVHAHFDDVMVVLDGSATLVTGGTVVDARTEGNGEEKGTAIKDGITHKVMKGDILHIPRRYAAPIDPGQGPDVHRVRGQGPRVDASASVLPLRQANCEYLSFPLPVNTGSVQRSPDCPARILSVPAVVLSAPELIFVGVQWPIPDRLSILVVADPGGN